jgi:hypothetical protein
LESSSIDLVAFERKISSQNGEDGILTAIFDAVGTSNRYVVEFGVEDGIECNSAHLLRDCGWRGFLIEGDDHQFQRLRERYRNNTRVQLAHTFVTVENIASIFAAHHVPNEPDLVSIDVDGNDYWIWKALESYRPRVVVIEYNASHPPPELWVMAYNSEHRWKGDSYFGASLASLARLGNAKGYALLTTETRGVNAFFLRRDLLAKSRFPERIPEQAYYPPGYVGATGALGHPFGEGPFLRI